MTLEGFTAAVAAATTPDALDALELQMIAIGHAHDGALRQSVAARRKALGGSALGGPAVRDAHRAHLVARVEMTERLSKDPQLPGADRVAELRATKHPDAPAVAEAHAAATEKAKAHYRAAGQQARAALAALTQSSEGR